MTCLEIIENADGSFDVHEYEIGGGAEDWRHYESDVEQN